MSLTVCNRDALLIKDVQYDFLPGGARGMHQGRYVLGQDAWPGKTAKITYLAA
jgi:nicotinamidase-related amidase